MGWLCVLGWQGGCASSSFMAGTMVQGLIALNHPDTYVPEGWHGTLLTIAVAAFAVFFNTFLARHLPTIESGLLAIHFLAFIGILATLWVMSPNISDASVFTQFNDGGGWNSFGVSTLAGITSGILPLLGADAAAHMVCIVGVFLSCIVVPKPLNTLLAGYIRSSGDFLPVMRGPEMVSQEHRGHMSRTNDWVKIRSLTDCNSLKSSSQPARQFHGQ